MFYCCCFDFDLLTTKFYCVAFYIQPPRCFSCGHAPQCLQVKHRLPAQNIVSVKKLWVKQTQTIFEILFLLLNLIYKIGLLTYNLRVKCHTF